MNNKNQEMHYEIIGNCLVIYISEDLDHHAVSEIREQSDRLIQAGGIRDIVFDFWQVEFMDSSGIGLIMGRYKNVMFSGGRVALTRVGKNVDRIFRMSGLYQIIQSYETVEQAMDALQKGRKKL